MALTGFTRRFATVLRRTGVWLGALALVAAAVCVVSMLLYVGFDHDPADIKLLGRLIKGGQAVFLINIVFNIVFAADRSYRRRTPVQWGFDLAMLLTVLPLFYPEPAHPWIPWLANILYNRGFLFLVIASYSVVQLSFGVMKLPGKRTNPSLMLSASFLLFIIIGSLLLMLPKSTYNGLSFVNSLFVSTSAVCITGLTTVDIYSTFTPMGLLILGILIEIGALGVMSFTCFFAVFFSGSQSIYSQLVIGDMIYSKSLSNLFPTLIYIMVTTLCVQAVGTVALFMTVPDALGYDTGEKIVFAAFHSISAFCNAGFSTLPGGLSNPALMTGNQSIYWVFSALIVAGAIGFPSLVNFKDAILIKIHNLKAWLFNRSRFGGYRRQVHLVDVNTKIVLTTFSLLFVFGAVMFFILEYNNTLAGMTLWQKVTQSVFNSVTPRSAGFSSVSPAQFMPVTLMIVMFLMWVGGSAQSTAGGVKVNTLAVIWLNLRSIVTGQRRVTAFKRTLAVPSIRRANAVVSISIFTYVLLSVTILIIEPGLSPRDLLFECASALFTVGSSLGVTASLSTASKIILCAAMFMGRVGVISLLSGIASTHKARPHYPTDNIIIN